MSASRPLRPEGSSEKDWTEGEEQLRQPSRAFQNSTQPPLATRILIIEDNPLDVKLLQHIFAYESQWRTEFVVLEDGEEAIEYLLHPETPKPDLVILDLKLPKRDGLDVLTAIRASEHLHGVRVVIFSSYPEAIIRSKMALANLEADDYINKPDGFNEFSSLAKRFRQCCDSNVALREYPASIRATA